MLSQRMSKEFVLVSLGLDPEGNKKKLHGSIKLFNDSLNDMIHGNEERNISRPPNDLVASNLQDVVNRWVPFADVLLSNVDHVRDFAGQAKVKVLKDVAAGNEPLLVQANIVVGNLAQAARSANMQTNGFVVDLAGRQRMLIQRMCKNAFLIASGVHVTSAVSSLAADQKLFYSSHKGIMRGADWAGVPPLVKVCTMHEMSRVTYYYDLFASLISEVSPALPVQQNIETAHRLAQELEERSGPLFSAMVAAVSLYVNDPGTCNPLDSMTASSWRIRILTTATVMADSQMTVAHFLELSNVVAVQQSIVDLIVGVSTISTSLTNLIEGNKAESIEAPPTQSLLDDLRDAKSLWEPLEEDLRRAITSTEIPVSAARRVSSLSQEFQDKLEAVRARLVEQALSLEGDFPEDIQAVSEAPLQSVLLAKMTTQVNLIFAEAKEGHGGNAEIAESNRVLFNSTRDAFLKGHRSILMGSPPADGKPARMRLSSVCGVQQMLKVHRSFGSYLQESEAAMAGSRKALEMLSLSTRTMYELTSSIARSLVSSDILPCQNDSLTADSWLEMVVAIGDLRAFSQEACTMYLISSSAGSAETAILAVKEKVLQKLQGILYGSYTLPAPSTQAIFEKLVETVEPPVLAFAESLRPESGGSDTTAVLKSLEVITALNSAQDLYLAEATRAHPGVPASRVDAACRQILLAQKAVREAVMFSYGHLTSKEASYKTMSEFMQLQQDLNLGGSGLPPIVPQRPDLLAQWAKVESAFSKLKNSLENDVASMLVSRDSLIAELETIRDLYKIPDQVDHTDQLPVMFIAYGIMGCMFCGCTWAAVCCHLRTSRRSATESARKQVGFGGSQA